MELFLVDTEPELVSCWNKEFSKFPEVKILCSDILSIAQNAIVSPANGYGYMDGGIDLLYLNYFGNQIQKTVLDTIAPCPEGYLPVGTSLVVHTRDKRIPYLIVSPTMLIPGPVN